MYIYTHNRYIKVSVSSISRAGKYRLSTSVSCAPAFQVGKPEHIEEAGGTRNDNSNKPYTKTQQQT